MLAYSSRVRPLKHEVVVAVANKLARAADAQRGIVTPYDADAGRRPHRHVGTKGSSRKRFHVETQHLLGKRFAKDSDAVRFRQRVRTKSESRGPVRRVLRTVCVAFCGRP